jgi:ATP-dependent RNA helicase SUPV3L1/SUV3
MSNDGVRPEEWLDRAVSRLDQVEGDVATLSGRLAQIRTWTYAAHRSGWVKDGPYWQERTRSIEDRLSDALHECLTQRFVDRRTSVLLKRLRQDDEIALALDDSGGVAIDGVSVGKLDGFRFVADPLADGIHEKTLRAATMRGLEGELYARARRLKDAGDAEIQLSEHGKLWWDGAVIGRLEKGPSPLTPRVSLLADDALKGISREWIATRLEDWIAQRIATVLEPLLSLKHATEAKSGAPEALPPVPRGIAHQLCEQLGSLDRDAISLPSDLGAVIRSLKRFGVWFGRRSIYLPKLLRPDASSLLALLWGVSVKQENLPPSPRPGLTSFAYDPALPLRFLAAAGFRVVAGRAVRLDMLERLEDELLQGARGGAGARALKPKLASLLGCDNETVDQILGELGWRLVPVTDRPEDEAVWRHLPDTRREHRKRVVRAKRDSPFADLASMIAAR